MTKQPFNKFLLRKIKKNAITLIWKEMAMFAW